MNSQINQPLKHIPQHQKKTPRVLLRGRFAPEDIEVSLGRSNRKIDPKMESQFDAIWARVKRAAKASGKNCYNGTNYRLNDFRVVKSAGSDGDRGDNHNDRNNNRRERERERERLEIEFSTIKYKIGSALHYLSETFLMENEYRHRICNCGAAVKTKNGKYVMVKMSGKSMNTKQADLPGGIVEKPLPLRNSANLFEHLYRELKEEAFITRRDIKDIFLQSIIQFQRGAVSLHFEVSLNISSKELRERFEKNIKKKDPDVEGLMFLGEEEFRRWLREWKGV